MQLKNIDEQHLDLTQQVAFGRFNLFLVTNANSNRFFEDVYISLSRFRLMLIVLLTIMLLAELSSFVISNIHFIKESPWLLIPRLLYLLGLCVLLGLKRRFIDRQARSFLAALYVFSLSGALIYSSQFFYIS